MALYSIVKYTGNGTNKEFVIPYSLYPIISSLIIKLDGVVASNAIYDIAPTNDKVVFKTAPTSGAVIEIERNTKIDKMQTNFQIGAVLKEKDLDDSFLQLLSLIQENRDMGSERYQVSETAPAFPQDGFIWHKKSTSITYMWDGVAWVDLHLGSRQASADAKQYADNAKASADNAANSLTSFNAKYKTQATAPTNPTDGMLWFDTTVDKFKVYTASDKTWKTIKDGKDGRGIKNVSINPTSGEYFLNYTDGTSESLGFLKGQKGDKGDSGSNTRYVEFDFGSSPTELKHDGTIYIYNDTSNVRSSATKTFDFATLVKDTPTEGAVIKFILAKMHASENVSLVFKHGSTTLLTTRLPDSTLIFGYNGSAWTLQYNSQFHAISNLGNRLSINDVKYLTKTDNIVSIENQKMVNSSGTKLGLNNLDKVNIPNNSRVQGVYATFDSSGNMIADISRMTIVELVDTEMAKHTGINKNKGHLTAGIINSVKIRDKKNYALTLALGEAIGEKITIDFTNWGHPTETLPNLGLEMKYIDDSSGVDEVKTAYVPIDYDKYGNNGSVMCRRWTGKSWANVVTHHPVARSQDGKIRQYDNLLAHTDKLLSQDDSGNRSLRRNDGVKIGEYGNEIVTYNGGGLYRGNGTEIQVGDLQLNSGLSAGGYRLNVVGGGNIDVASVSMLSVLARTNMSNLSDTGKNVIKELARLVPSGHTNHANKQVFNSNMLSKSPDAFDLTNNDSRFLTQIQSMVMKQRSGGSITNYQVLPNSPTLIKIDSNSNATITYVIYIPKGATIDYDANSGMVRKYTDGSGNLGFKVTYSSKKHEYFAQESAGTIDDVLIHEHKFVNNAEHTFDGVTYDRYVMMTVVMQAQRINNQNRITPVLDADMPDTSTQPFPFSMVAEQGVLGQVTEYLNPVTVVDTYTKSEIDGKVNLKANLTLDNVTNNTFSNKIKSADSNILKYGSGSGDYITVTDVAGSASYVFLTQAGANKKANKTDVYTKAETTNELNKKADKTSVYTRTQSDGKYRTIADSYTKAEADTKYLPKADLDTKSTILTKTTSGAWTKKTDSENRNTNIYTGSRLKTDGTIYIFDDSTINTSTSRWDNSYRIFLWGADSVAPTGAKAGDTLLFHVGGLYIDPTTSDKNTRFEIIGGSSASDRDVAGSLYSTCMFRYDGSAWRVAFNDSIGGIRQINGALLDQYNGNISAYSNLLSLNAGKVYDNVGTEIKLARLDDRYDRVISNGAGSVYNNSHTFTITTGSFDATPDFVLSIQESATDATERARYKFTGVTTDGTTYTGTKIDSYTWWNQTWQIRRISSTTFSIRNTANSNFGNRRVLILLETKADVYTRAEVDAMQTGSTLIYGNANGSDNKTSGTLQLTGSHTWTAFDEVIFEIAYANGTRRTQQPLYIGKTNPITTSNGADATVGDSTNYVDFNWNGNNRLDITANSNYGISRIYGKVY